MNEDGSWYLPEKTLGWQILGWCSSYLLNDRGEPWRFTLEQSRFVLWWYAIDERGRFLYRSGVLQRLKGWLSGARIRSQPPSALQSLWGRLSSILSIATENLSRSRSLSPT